jgi:flagellar hook-associated protein 3 FlgL
MQVSTNQFYNMNQQSMSSLGSQADRLQGEVATGKKLLAPSDDAISYRRLQGIKTANSNDTAYTANITLAQSTLSQADTTMSTLTDEIQRAKELAVKANSGTLSPSDRGVIADELDSILQTLVSTANSKDARGASIFADDANPAVVDNGDGTFTYSTKSPASIPVSDTSSVQPGEPASRLFSLSGGGDILSQISALSTALRGTGNISTIAGTVGDQLSEANNNIGAVQGSLGARAQRVDLDSKQMTTTATDREVTRSAMEDADPTQVITDLQKTMTILSAAQASFTKLTSLSLFDYLR